MRRIGVQLLAAALVAVLASPVYAQRGGFGFGGAPSKGMLLANEGVQKELKLTEDQVKKVGNLQRDIFTKYRDKFQDAAGDREKMQEIMKEINKETDKVIADTLKPEQVKRLNQIELQVGGLRAFENEAVAKELKFTDDQKKELTELNKELGTYARETLMDAGRDMEKRQEAMKKIQEKNAKALEKFTKTLNADQQKKLKELEGEKFDYKPQPFRPRRDA